MCAIKIILFSGCCIYSVPIPITQKVISTTNNFDMLDAKVIERFFINLSRISRKQTVLNQIVILQVDTQNIIL